jgi:hypothetical protein
MLFVGTAILLLIIAINGFNLLSSQQYYEQKLHDKQVDCDLCLKTSSECYNNCTLVGRDGTVISFSPKFITQNLTWGFK